MRYLLAAFLVALGAYLGWLAYGPLHNLWADYQDSPASTYLLFGLPLLALSVAAFASAAMVLRKH